MDWLQNRLPEIALSVGGSCVVALVLWGSWVTKRLMHFSGEQRANEERDAAAVARDAGLGELLDMAYQQGIVNQAANRASLEKVSEKVDEARKESNAQHLDLRRDTKENLTKLGEDFKGRFDELRQDIREIRKDG